MTAQSLCCNKNGIKAFILTGLFLFFSIPPVLADDDSDNPYLGIRLSRLSYLSGEVLLQRGDDEEWIPSSVNMPLRPHDKIWSTEGARTELQFDDGSIIRLAGNTNVDLLNLEQTSTQLQLTLGTATFVTRFSSRINERGFHFEVDTPQAAILVDGPANFRVEVREDGSAEISVREGRIRLSTDDEPVLIARDQRIVIDSNENPRYTLESISLPDDWDDWNSDRDRQIAQAVSRRYLPSDLSMGITELDTYGVWREVPAYGWVWAPQVAIDWAPYRTGRWVWIEPWGWTWVSYEPWGWVPFHYGRWIMASGSWVWVPGRGREIWSPGQVRFIHGPDWVAWVPLAPGEPYYFRPREIRQVHPGLINYRVPGATTLLPRSTFITGAPMTGRFTPPPDPIRTGRVIVGPPPVLPAQTSLRPRPLDETRARLLPPRIVNRSVIYDHPVSIPPPRFENRMKDLKEGVEQGNPPITVRPHVEEKPIPRFDEARDRERIHRDFTVRKTIKEPVRESPRSFSPPQRERETPSPLIKPRPTPPVRPVEPGKKAPARGSEPKQLYRKPPPPLRQQEAR